MTTGRAWHRRPLTWALVVLLALGGGLVGAREAWGDCWPMHPHDARAYRQYDCANLGGPRNLATLLRYYAVTLPPDATGVRYYSDDNSATGPDVLFLRFTAPAGTAADYLAALHGTPVALTPDAALHETARLRHRDHVDWEFPPGLDHRVLSFGPTPAGTAVSTPDGAATAIVRLTVLKP
ncbi:MULTISPECIES: hypothetical protein [Kitasatospora]|uniref:Uncharacterized protein n=1 Tax=Kitasatospora setae (strain ATCC 33774 / DSM 43861 / JCM 3304 / KCC A-0304 / NBRC 14216 / KM-6054) TaxID=452652 RepID=E4NFV0_KITSK|nr:MULTISPECIES: hypothetical protein [Kitasatospora]BAJ30380.1 hypothetical protein KSE_45990 [Kitasatospora setae KM-6054]